MIITILDYLLAPLYVIIIHFIASSIKNKYVRINPIYKYYLPGLYAKIFGAIAVCFIYAYYYGGGDTTDYFQGVTSMVNLYYKDVNVFFSILLGNTDTNNFSVFDSHTGWPQLAMWNDPNSFFVIRFVTPFCFFGLKQFVLTTILLAWVTYAGIWKLYLLLCELFPMLWKKFAIAVLFIPSVVFWGSGLLKDTITLSATCWFAYSFYKALMKKEKIFLNGCMLVVTSSVILSIKPYIFLALLPGMLFWLSYNKIVNIKSIFIKVVAAPVIICLFGFVGFWMLTSFLADEMGKYKPDKFLEKAVINQQDLTRSEQYGQNYFDIGKFEATPGSIISKAPQAVVAALFRPFLWEAKNPVMIVSAIENTVILCMVFWLILKVGLIKFLTLPGKHPLLLFALAFSLVFAFGVGLSTANFGALVRYKIPAMPFFVASLFIMQFYATRGAISRRK